MSVHTLESTVKTSNTLAPNTISLTENELRTASDSGDFFAHFSADQVRPLFDADDTVGICINPELVNGRLELRMGRSTALEEGIVDDPVGHPARPIFARELKFTDVAARDKWTKELENKKWLFRKVYFSADDLDALMENTGGLFFRAVAVNIENVTGQPEKFHTLVVYTGNNNNSPLNGMASALPCPPHCGNGDYKKRISAIRPD